MEIRPFRGWRYQTSDGDVSLPSCSRKHAQQDPQVRLRVTSRLDVAPPEPYSAHQLVYPNAVVLPTPDDRKALMYFFARSPSGEDELLLHVLDIDSTKGPWLTIPRRGRHPRIVCRSSLLAVMNEFGTGELLELPSGRRVGPPIPYGHLTSDDGGRFLAVLRENEDVWVLDTETFETVVLSGERHGLHLDGALITADQLYLTGTREPTKDMRFGRQPLVTQSWALPALTKDWEVIGENRSGFEGRPPVRTSVTTLACQTGDNEWTIVEVAAGKECFKVGQAASAQASVDVSVIKDNGYQSATGQMLWVEHTDKRITVHSVDAVSGLDETVMSIPKRGNDDVLGVMSAGEEWVLVVLQGKSGVDDRMWLTPYFVKTLERAGDSLEVPWTSSRVVLGKPGKVLLGCDKEVVVVSAMPASQPTGPREDEGVSTSRAAPH